jgi:hypothetical protein
MSMVDFQSSVGAWLLECFGPMIAGDKDERSHRFLEEAVELVQACGCSKSEALQIVDYVYARPVGVVRQEVGGSAVTLAALCEAHGISMEAAAMDELERIEQPAMVLKIRAKQAAKPKFSPLPEAAPVDHAARVQHLEAVLLAVKQQFDQFGHTFPDRFDTQVFRRVDGAVATSKGGAR